jgi:hypothetical protein
MLKFVEWAPHCYQHVYTLWLELRRQLHLKLIPTCCLNTRWLNLKPAWTSLGWTETIDQSIMRLLYIKQIGCFHVWCRAIWLDLEWAPIWVVTWTVMVDRSAWRHMLHNVNSLWAVSTKCKRWKSSNLYRGSELRRASAIDCFNHWNHSWFTVALTLAAVCYR